MLYINQRDYPDMPYPNNAEGELKEKVDSAKAEFMNENRAVVFTQAEGKFQLTEKAQTDEEYAVFKLYKEK